MARQLLGSLVLLLTGAVIGAPAQSSDVSNHANRSKTTVSPGVQRDRHLYTNRLIHEKSPYLLLHAHNPVDWYPWGEEAFAKARQEQKPIFLSVGYYTCHWCHVMERESYSNPAVAKLLNRWFVAIKVDREERPDIDQAYMSFVEATTGSGGWPMNVVLTPELKPFFGGTYFPPDDKNGRAGLTTLLPRIADLWSHQRTEIERSASNITGQLQKLVETTASNSGELDATILDKAFQEIKETYDPVDGGFGGAPKFPRPVVLEFLLRYWSRTHKQEALDMVLKTLHSMAAGGVHDQIGGGFHRYATDAHWHVPHFEKMLYDQAQLATVYLEAFQITHDSFYADTARDILDFSLREMRDPAGGFYSALDADSQLQRGSPKRGEGTFYAWSASDIEHVLAPETATVFEFRYGVNKEGNVPSQQDIEGWLAGKNVLYQEHTLEETAQKFGKSLETIQQLLSDARKKLFTARRQRPIPPADTKVIAAWNGMMISALARASQVLNEPRYLVAAQRTSAFFREHLYQTASGKLKRRYRAGSSEIDGYLDDYAWAIKGALDLYEADFDAQSLSWAIQLQRAQDRLFKDNTQGGYFSTTGTDKSILWRSREGYDGVEPSPNSVAVLNLMRIWQLTNQQGWKDEADKTLATFSAQLQKSAESMPLMAAALDLQLSPHRQIVIAGARGAADTDTLLRLVWQRFLPNSLLLLADGGEGQQQIAKFLPLVVNMTRKQGKATAYICENYVCKLPAADPRVVEKLLDAGR